MVMEWTVEKGSVIMIMELRYARTVELWHRAGILVYRLQSYYTYLHMLQYEGDFLLPNSNKSLYIYVCDTRNINMTKNGFK